MHHGPTTNFSGFLLSRGTICMGESGVQIRVSRVLYACACIERCHGKTYRLKKASKIEECPNLD